MKPGPHHNHRGGYCPQVTEDRYSKALVVCLTIARDASLAILSAEDQSARVKLSRMHERMDDAVFEITGVRYCLATKEGRQE